MKRYIVCHTKNEDVLEFSFELFYTLEDYRIAANFNPDADEEYLDKEINLSIRDEYDAFIKRVRIYIYQFGFTELNFKKSNRNNSNSVYIDFCRESEYEKQQIRCVFYLRISDHRLKKRKGKNTGIANRRDTRYDRQAAQEQFHEQDANSYKWYNLDPDEPIDYVDISIIVNGNKFKTYGEAMEHVKNRIRQYTKK